MTAEDSSGPSEDSSPTADPLPSAMSLTYSDFIYPHTETDIQEQGIYLQSSTPVTPAALPHDLPSEFQVIQESAVPLLQNADEADQDFIVIAEFSELEGPIPLCTIPNDAPDKTDIDLNSLAVHLMSTDYQVNTVGQFSICEDTQVNRTNVFLNVHVFMQYFTLYDIKARGFVRPFCFGYVSKDHVKLERCVKSLVQKFNEITKVLKQTNRIWFARELTHYLAKLRAAKESFILRTAAPGDDVEYTESDEIAMIFENTEDSEPITLNQIAHQYTEIENIFKTVQDVPSDTNSLTLIERIENHCYAGPDSRLNEMLAKLDFIGDTFHALDIPLVHPLKQKGESLRPLTTLGQFGTLALVLELREVYEQKRMDLIFTEMRTLTQDFGNHFKITKSDLTRESARSTFRPFDLEDRDLSLIIEKIHTSVPLAPSDDRSGSYHSCSDESDVQIPSRTQMRETDLENGNPSYLSVFGSIESKENGPEMGVTPSPAKSPIFVRERSPPKPIEPINSLIAVEDAGMSSSWTILEPSLSPGSFGSSSEDESSPAKQPATDSSAPLEIDKVPWWNYVSNPKLQRGDHGYGILKFFRHFYKVAHHILFSILIGRPVIFCGSSNYRSKVFQIVNSLVPLIPCCPEKSFKVLHWHQGILVRAHFSCSYKLIGLCIPERHSVHDLVHPRDQNSVTVLDVESKKLLGPAYSGNYFTNFEDMTCQKYFFDDHSLITYLGSIFSDLESQIYMAKSMQIDGEDSMAKIMKELDLKNSDAEIIKYLVSRIDLPQQSVDIF